jgi:hypothetical protein
MIPPWSPAVAQGYLRGLRGALGCRMWSPSLPARILS